MVFAAHVSTENVNPSRAEEDTLSVLRVAATTALGTAIIRVNPRNGPTAMKHTEILKARRALVRRRILKNLLLDTRNRPLAELEAIADSETEAAMTTPVEARSDRRFERGVEDGISVDSLQWVG
jgi:hypothetical protein